MREIVELPRIDEHVLTIDCDADEVWRALVSTVDATFSRSAASTYARLIGCPEHEVTGPRPLEEGSTIPGFRIARAEPPRTLVLEGRHRFSVYALIFRLEGVDASRTRLGAETRAGFPGVGGAIYRALVIGTHGHAFGVRRLLSAVGANCAAARESSGR